MVKIFSPMENFFGVLLDNATLKLLNLNDFAKYFPVIFLLIWYVATYMNYLNFKTSLYSNDFAMKISTMVES